MSEQKFRPVLDKIVIKPQDRQSTSTGGVILPESAQDEATIGEVIAAGPGYMDFTTGKINPLQTKVGDIVLFPKFGMLKFEYDGDAYVIGKENDILTIINKA